LHDGVVVRTEAGTVGDLTRRRLRAAGPVRLEEQPLGELEAGSEEPQMLRAEFTPLRSVIGK
jgi:hypothetical protein